MVKLTRKELIAKYPTRFEDVGTWFECGDGWLGLIDELCTNLEAECKRSGASYCVAQVKEKFGGLRFYINTTAGHREDTLFELEDIYEGKSFKVCEMCGDAGTVRPSGWVKTLCDVCHEKRNK